MGRRMWAHLDMLCGLCVGEGGCVALVNKVLTLRYLVFFSFGRYSSGKTQLFFLYEIGPSLISHHLVDLLCPQVI